MIVRRGGQAGEQVSKARYGRDQRGVLADIDPREPEQRQAHLVRGCRSPGFDTDFSAETDTPPTAAGASEAGAAAEPSFGADILSSSS